MDDPLLLRARARHLDDVAGQLEGSPAMTMHCRADDTAWRGGLAEQCRRELVDLASALTRVATALRSQAHHCRRRADALEALPP
jgi:hypothetical protein